MHFWFADTYYVNWVDKNGKFTGFEKRLTEERDNLTVYYFVKE